MLSIESSSLKIIAIISIVSVAMVLLYSHYKKNERRTLPKGLDLDASGYTLEHLYYDSKPMQKRKTVFVFLPRDYKNTNLTKYPVIYKTDGNGHMEHWLNAINVLSAAGVSPRPIFVNIKTNEQRTLQLLPEFLPRDPFKDPIGQKGGQANLLLDFIKQELIPDIEYRYRTSSTRILAGHSMGALFTLYAFIKDPNLFTGHFAISPSLWVKQGGILKEFEYALNKNNIAGTYLYFSRGTLEAARFLPEKESKNLPNLYHSLAVTLSNTPSKQLKWRYDVHPYTDHKHSPIPSIPAALVDFFSEYQNSANMAASSSSPLHTQANNIN